MTRRDRQTGDPADGQVSLVIHHAGKCGFDSLRSCAGRHWGERFRIGSNQVVALGSCDGTARWGAVWGWLPANLLNPEPTTSTARPAPRNRTLVELAWELPASGVPVG